MSQELINYQVKEIEGGQVVPQTIDGMMKVCEIYAASGLVPKGMESPEALFVAGQMGAALGLSFGQSIQNIAVINGKPAVWGDMMLGLVKASPHYKDIDETFEGTGENAEAVCTVWRNGEAKPAVGKFSYHDAKRAGLWGKQGPWTQYPKRMMQMRARAFALRDKFPDILKGVYAREEMEGNEVYMGEASVVSSVSEGLKKSRPEAVVAPVIEVDEETGEIGTELDSRGIPWISGVHSPNMTKNKDGSWRRAKFVDPEHAAMREKAALDAMRGQVEDEEPGDYEEEEDEVGEGTKVILVEATDLMPPKPKAPKFDYQFFVNAYDTAGDAGEVDDVDDVLNNCRSTLTESQIKVLEMMSAKKRHTFVK
jgi:hypothetical protein